MRMRGYSLGGTLSELRSNTSPESRCCFYIPKKRVAECDEARRIARLSCERGYSEAAESPSQAKGLSHDCVDRFQSSRVRPDLNLGALRKPAQSGKQGVNQA
jgi:hypothetical protein